MWAFIRAIAASLIARVLFTIFIAGFAILGFGPADWAEWLMNHTPLQFAYIGAAMFMTLVFAANAYTWWPRAGSIQARRLSPSTMDKLTSALKSEDFAVEDVAVRYTTGDGESQDFADDFVDVLRRFGWKGKSTNTFDENVQMRGLRLGFDPEKGKSTSAVTLAQALKSAGVAFEWEENEGPLERPTFVWVHRKP